MPTQRILVHCRALPGDCADGTILEFVGDCIIIVWNTFKSQQTRMVDILFCTMRALRRMRMHNALSSQAGLPEIQVGVGLHTGPVALGYLGGLPRCHLTVLGNTINLAARIESSRKEFPAEVIASSSCFEGGSPAVWREPSSVNFSVRDLGEHTMRNIERPVHLYGLSPLLRSWVDFAPMGFMACPEQGVVYLDTGNSGEPGIIDHHHESHTENSACELLLSHPELLLEHLKAEERRLTRQDRSQYQEDMRQRSHTYRARVNGIETPVAGLWLDHPQSVFFTLWARNDPDAPGGKEYQFLGVDWSQPGKNRFIISVDPDAGTNLEGLGQLLEQHETKNAHNSEKSVPSIRFAILPTTRIPGISDRDINTPLLIPPGKALY